MTAKKSRPALGVFGFIGLAMAVSIYFIFAAVQGDYGLFRRVEIVADKERLEAELLKLETEVARMENLTHRLSDSYLDLDLLDQQARDVLGLLRSDEIVVR
ncbi:FtsB family cell division protein [Shimia haliotis]|uniref:Cell division protein FtsB n=1 Tax=Shimia haliotis TaxID=1280847 RepID=A0A1I4BC43_9RHOB|nr:septum formation initiator family protein [Shimia haliotis]SFK66392.1 Cell division protein FtsB [Shimia haliotis]